MKILITSDWYDPVVNGVVRSILNLKSYLEDRADCRQSRWKPQVHLLFLCDKRLNQAIFGYKYTKDGGSYAT